MSKLTQNFDYIGFSSVGKNIDYISKDFSKILHICGKSPQKGTKTLLDIWSKNPHLPTLTVISTIKEHSIYRSINNIKLIDYYITDSELCRLLNESGIHICPSETEGYGHTIAEALSTGSVILTTDSAPMNEIVSDNNQLISVKKASRRHHSNVAYIDGIDLLNKTNYLIANTNILSTIGDRNKKRFIENRTEFLKNLDFILSSILS